MFVTTGTGTAVGSVNFFDSGVNFSSAVIILCGESRKALQGKQFFIKLYGNGRSDPKHFKGGPEVSKHALCYSRFHK